MLDVAELFEIEGSIRDYFNDHIEEIISKLNRIGKLEVFLDLIGCRELLGQSKEYCQPKNGKIIVIGASKPSQENLEIAAGKLGISKTRFEFFLEYDASVRFAFRKAKWSTQYSAIMVGPMPHSGTSKGDYDSVISALEHDEGYPPVIRMGTTPGQLKITTSSFVNALKFMRRKY